MANEDKLYIEQRPDSRYAVRWGNAQRASVVMDTQREPIEWAKEPDIERVRNTEKGGRDKWRKAY